MELSSCKIKVGVIGVGALGRHHARLYAQNPRAEVVGIFDVCKENAQKVGAEFGLAVFDEWRELAAKCDALSVAVPATLHGTTTVPLLEMGKHVLVEKPIAATVAEAESMVAAAANAGVVLAVGHVERFNPAMDFLMQQQGKIRWIEAQRLAKYPPPRKGLPPRGTEVSVILDLMIHDLDLVLTLADSEVEKIDVFGMSCLSASEDFASARIRFVNGCCADVTASRIAAAPMRRVSVLRETGCCSMDFGNHSGSVQTPGKEELSCEEVTLPEKNALAEELDDFLAAVIQSKAAGRAVEPRVPGTAGLKALKLAAAIEDAARRA